MMKNQDFKNFTKWMKRRLEISDFYEIFNVPNTPNKEIHEAIRRLQSLSIRYGNFLSSIKKKNDKGRTEEFFILLFADILSELAISIKLAGEGYIKYSLREIRATLDLAFMGVFTISSWPAGGAKSKRGINPMANAIMSGQWGKMSTFKNFDRLVLSELYFRKGGVKRSVRETVHKLSRKFYDEIIEEFGLNKKLSSNSNKNEMLEGLLDEFLIELMKMDVESWKKNVRKTLSPNFFYFTLMDHDDVMLRACDSHKNELLGDLKRKLGIEGELTQELIEELSQLAFRPPSTENHHEDDFARCKYCGNEATIYAIYSRPDTPEMKKLIKYQLQKDKLNAINLCVKKYFELKNKKIKDKYFGDIIYSEIYTKLNDYVHANIVEEPTVSDWFNNLYIPTVEVLDCILSPYLRRGD